MNRTVRWQIVAVFCLKIEFYIVNTKFIWPSKNIEKVFIQNLFELQRTQTTFWYKMYLIIKGPGKISLN